MASSIFASSGKSLGSRHNSHNNLVASDSVSDWLNASGHDNTPKAPTTMTTQPALLRHDSFASLTDGFDMVSPPMLTWSNTAESKIMGLNNADDYLSNLAEHSIDLKSTFTDTLHIDDFFHESASNSSSSSPYMTTTINLPGWNHGPEVVGGLDSDVDSPESIWYGQTQAITSKAARRSSNVPSFSFNVEASDTVASPGAPTSIGFETLNPTPPSTDRGSTGLLGAPARTLRSCISAPLLQRDDPVLEAAGTQHLINDFLVDAGFPQERIPDSNALGLELGPQSSAVSSPAHDAGVQGNESGLNQTGLPLITELTGSASVAQSSALFQRRAVQRDLHAPSPVAVPTTDGGDQTIEVSPGRTVTINNPTESAIDPEKMTDEQRRRLAQLHQIHVAQQAARLGVYQDFVAPSQQFAGQEASERAAKAVQAALMYGMEGNSPRKLSMGSTGLPTPVTPQHPLQPGPSSMANAAYHPHMQNYVGVQMQGYPGANFDPRMPGMPLSADSANFAPSIQNQFSNLHLAQQSQQQQQGVFTQQFLHQHDATLYAGQANANSQDMSGYTSVYPPPRHNSISNGSIGHERSGGMYGLTLAASGMVGVGQQLGGDQMLLAPRRPSYLGRAESSPTLASQIAANPMQLQNPFNSQQAQAPPQQQQTVTTLEPSKLMGTSEMGLMPPASSTPRSAPADASREHLAMQQTRMRQLQQQQLQFLQMQNQAVANKQAESSGAAQVTSRKAPNLISAPLSPPRSPAKMKSTPHLRSPLGGIVTGLPPSPSKPTAQGLRKIASNRRINTTTSSLPVAGGSNPGSTSSSSSSTSTGMLKSKGSTIGTGGFTLELTTSASPTRARTISHQSTLSSRSTTSPGKSKSPTPSALGSGSGGFSQLSFVNYGMNDADEICSAVAPSGSYKVPLRGFGSSSGEDDDFDDDASSVRTRTMSNVTGFTGTMGSDDDGDSPGSTTGAPPGSPTKKVRKNSSRPNLLFSPGSSSASPLKSKRSMANLGGAGGSRAWDLTRSPRKTKSTILSPVSSAGSGE
ncbi:Developmental regulatory protein [Pseudozyma hubeiensis]|nr:Developmental regulatory protein [Pseudozyma hubeiensis]